MTETTKLEQEIKLDLQTSEALERIVTVLGQPMRVEHQHNHYLDDAQNRLAQARVMLRVRVSDSASIVAIKRSVSVDDGYFRMEEEEHALPHPWSGDPTELDAHPCVANLRQAHQLGPLRLRGSVVNRRRCFDHRGLCLELDETRFPGDQRRYELELETDDAATAQPILRSLLANCAVDYVPQRTTKYQQFLQALADIERGQD